jgi:molecular chaperone DnaJ
MRPLRLPPGTQSGQRFRVRGYGLPHRRHGSEPGNLLVRVQVVLPTTVTPEERRVIEAFSARGGDPRERLWRPKEQ